MAFKRFSPAAAAALLAASTAASADVAARYETQDKDAPFDMGMSIEADDRGNVRMQMPRLNTYFIFRDGTLYQITQDRTGAFAVRVEDALIVQQEMLAKLGMRMPADMPEPDLVLAPVGPETVGTRQGMGYGLTGKDSAPPNFAAFVISDDPALAPIGMALALANANSLKGMGEIGTMLGLLNDELLAMLRKGAPLRIMSMELTDVSTDPIPPARFTLPAPPTSLAELRAMADQTSSVEPPPTLPPRAE